jgi:hypothetical protein
MMRAKNQADDPEEAAGLYLKEWAEAGVSPATADDRLAFFKDVADNLRRAFKHDKEWVRKHLKSSSSVDVLAIRVATALTSVVSMTQDAIDNDETSLDRLNIELLVRGQQRVTDVDSARKELQKDHPRVVELQGMDEEDDDEEKDIDEDDEGSKAGGRKPAPVVECKIHKGMFHLEGEDCLMCKTEVDDRRSKLKPSVKREEREEFKGMRRMLEKLTKQKKHKYDGDTSSDSDSDSGEDDDSFDWKASQALTSEDVLNDTLMTMLTDGIMKSKLKPDADGDYMNLTYNRLLLRNQQIMKQLRKLGQKKGSSEALARATVLSEEYGRNNKELSLLDRGIEEAKSDPKGAREKVALISKRRLGDTEENKEWKRAEKELRMKERTELGRRMLYGQPSHDGYGNYSCDQQWPKRPRYTMWQGDEQPTQRNKQWVRPGFQSGGNQKQQRNKPLDSPIISKGPNLEIGPYAPENQRIDKTGSITCNYCGGPHAGSWECSVEGTPRWKFKEGLIDRWGNPIHPRQQ